MGFANVRSDNILRTNNHIYSYKIENLCEPYVTFSEIKGKNYDPSTFVCICLHLSSNSSTLVYIRLWLVQWLVYVFKIVPIYKVLDQECEKQEN